MRRWPVEPPIEVVTLDEKRTRDLAVLSALPAGAGVDEQRAGLRPHWLPAPAPDVAAGARARTNRSSIVGLLADIAVSGGE